MSTQGDPVRGVDCPKCKQETVVYSGNYFCEDYDCDWAMSEGDRGKRVTQNKKIIHTYLMQRRAEAVAAGRTEEITRMDFYLANE